MDSSPPRHAKDRAFEPSKIPAGEAAHRLVSDFVARIEPLESRKRARKPRDQVLFLRMAAALILDLTHRELTAPGLWLSVSLQKAQYGTKTRTAPFLTEAFPTLVKLLGRDPGTIEIKMGHQGAFGTGKRTVIRAGCGLRKLIEASEVELSDIGRDRALRGDVIVLKGPKIRGKARNRDFDDTDEVRRMRAQVETINGWIADADLWWCGDEAEDRIDLGDRFLRRIFNNGTFDAGGRLFGGFWQHAKSDKRIDGIMFDECSAVALDFGQMAVRTAYSMQDASPPDGGDLYDVPGLGPKHREGTKRILNALLAADGIPQRFPKGTRKYFSRSWKFPDVYAPIATHHHALKPLFGTSQSLRLMNKESHLLVEILLRLKEQGVVALPVHDCLLVGQKDECITKAMMEECCKELLGVEGRVEISRSTTKVYPLGPLSSPSSPLQRGA